MHYLWKPVTTAQVNTAQVTTTQVTGGGGVVSADIFRKFDFELAVQYSLSGPPGGSNFLGVFEVPELQAPAWRHAKHKIRIY